MALIWRIIFYFRGHFELPIYWASLFFITAAFKVLFKQRRDYNSCHNFSLVIRNLISFHPQVLLSSQYKLLPPIPCFPPSFSVSSIFSYCSFKASDLLEYEKWTPINGLEAFQQFFSWGSWKAKLTTARGPVLAVFLSRWHLASFIMTLLPVQSAAEILLIRKDYEFKW